MKSIQLNLKIMMCQILHLLICSLLKKTHIRQNYFWLFQTKDCLLEFRLLFSFNPWFYFAICTLKCKTLKSFKASQGCLNSLNPCHSLLSELYPWVLSFYHKSMFDRKSSLPSICVGATLTGDNLESSMRLFSKTASSGFILSPLVIT